MASRMRLILEAYRTRLQAISKANGFATDAGLAIYMGESPDLGEHDPKQAIAILMGTQTPKFSRENVPTDWPIVIHGIARADLDEPLLMAVDIVDDIKRAVELDDRTLGGLVTPWFERGDVEAVEREPGATSVAVSITYTQLLVERWGHP